MSLPTIIYYQLLAPERAEILREFSHAYSLQRATSLEQIAALTREGLVTLILLGAANGAQPADSAEALVQRWMLPPAALFILASTVPVQQQVALFRLGVADCVATSEATSVLLARIAARLRARSCALKCRAQDMALQLHQLNYLHHYDLLTGLPNAAQFIEQLERMLQANAGVPVTVFVACLAHFRDINQVWGRPMGDQVLKLIATRLRTGFGSAAAVARVSGHSFALALHCADPQQLIRWRATLATLLDQPIELATLRLQPAALIGCASSKDTEHGAETLLRNAEAALQHLLCSGEQFAIHTPALQASIVARLAMETQLCSAVAQQQLIFHFQPQIDLHSGHIIGAEALLRWQHPERGLIAPAEFIPLAEQTRQIIPIGRWVIDTVCAQQAQWKAQGLPIVPVALNLSALQFRSTGLLVDIQQALIRHGVEPSSIELEVTETLVMQDPAAAEAIMLALRAAGLSLALDDFGTGYSSLAYLKRFPFSTVKMDRAFVTDIAIGRVDAAIARAIIGMGHSLNLTVIAEGVETLEQLRLLRESGCDQIQGYYFSKPVPAAQFAHMLRHGLRLAA